MTVSLTVMNETDFQQFLDIAAVNFADEKVKNGSWKPEAALSESYAGFNRLLPDREKTAGHYLYNIMQEERNIGFLWYEIKQEGESRYAFLFEILVVPEARGQGYGTEALRLMIREIRERGIEDIELHVFGHNQGAVKLYQRIGFEITDYNMRLSVPKTAQAGK
ncbi:GNAT family N-acetyltransferase [Paenibacillus filicis]|uniref:GNAT family N-acetyltransferase n=1 Tax=Paenibacillus filicis TaxID=669464 RepID=A0ABU9DH68_9BACL